MKKLLCLTLVLLILAGIAVMPAYAEEYPENNYYIGESCGYEIWWIDPQPEPALTDEIICDYWLTSSSVYGALLSAPSAIYAVKGVDRVYIKQACEMGLINPKDIAQIINNFQFNGYQVFDMSLFGDANRNGLLEIADAIIIQKILAKQTTSTSWLNRICDLDHNTNINLEDVILLQKKIAKIAV